MNRRNFIKKVASAAAATIVLPYILPTGRLFAATGTRIANHVVVCMLAGGIRSLESIHKADGNLMPNLLVGSEPISSDIAGAMDALPPSPLAAPLQTQASFYKNFRYNSRIAGHFQGHAVLATGAYVNEFVNFSDYSPKPTIFEYYRKHNSPAQTALNAWWVSLYTGENEFLSHSTHPDYGVNYGANFLVPNAFLPYNYESIDLCRTFSPAQKTSVADMQQFLNQNFKQPLPTSNAVNTPAERLRLEQFYTNTINAVKSGALSNPWGAGNAMNGDMLNVMFAERIIKEFKPELLMVNMTNVDVAHDRFTASCNNLRKADFATAHLWNTIQNTPGMQNDTIMIVVPEHGRDQRENTITDQYGRHGTDHGGDAMSSEIFCMVAGPANKVYQNNVINAVQGESIDIVPTVAHILGFHNDIPAGLLQGTPLFTSFK